MVHIVPSHVHVYYILVCQGCLSSFDCNLQYSLHVSLKFRQAPCTNIPVSSALFKIRYSLSYNKPHSTLPAVHVQDCWFQTITSIKNSNHYYCLVSQAYIGCYGVYFCRFQRWRLSESKNKWQPKKRFFCGPRKLLGGMLCFSCIFSMYW